MDKDLQKELKDILTGIELCHITGDPNWDFGEPTKEELEHLDRVLDKIFSEEE